ncbi:hypothetical protein HGA34_00035 [Candidatus Falkowbacteria bacterium]|nr:hypothetical protein [Candidatus Falkowbacteria bacterium]
MSQKTLAPRRLAAITAIAAFSLYLGNLYLVSAEAAAPNNSTPVLFPLDQLPTQANAGSAIYYQLAAFDPDNDPLTFSMSPAIAGASLNPATGEFSWTPTAAQAGAYNITFSVTDGIDTDSIPASLTIDTSINLPPVINPIAGQSATVGQTVSFEIIANDPENQILSYNVGLPAGASFNATSHVFTWTPTASQVGTNLVGVTVSDGINSVSTQVSITINAAPTETSTAKPVFISLSDKSIAAGKTLSFNVRAYSPTGRAVKISARNLPENAKFDSSTQTFSWEPTRRDIGTHEVTFIASDGISKTSKKIEIKVYRNSYSSRSRD